MVKAVKCAGHHSQPLLGLLSPLRWLGTKSPSHSRREHPTKLVERNGHLLKGVNAMETVFPSCGDGLSIFLLPATLPHFTQSHDASPCFPVRVHPRVPKSSRPQVLMSWPLTPMTTSWKLFPGGLSRLNLSLSS